MSRIESYPIARSNHAHHETTQHYPPDNHGRGIKGARCFGDYASESEVVRDGLRALFARDEAVESWLRTEVISAYDELNADPSIAVSASDLRAHLAVINAQSKYDS